MDTTGHKGRMSLFREKNHLVPLGKASYSPNSRKTRPKGLGQAQGHCCPPRHPRGRGSSTFFQEGESSGRSSQHDVRHTTPTPVPQLTTSSPLWQDLSQDPRSWATLTSPGRLLHRDGPKQGCHFLTAKTRASSGCPRLGGGGLEASPGCHQTSGRAQASRWTPLANNGSPDPKPAFRSFQTTLGGARLRLPAPRTPTQEPGAQTHLAPLQLPLPYDLAHSHSEDVPLPYTLAPTNTICTSTCPDLRT